MSGMDMLKDQRDKRRKVGNEMPPSLHPPRSSPVNLPAAEPDSAIADKESTTAVEQASAEAQVASVSPAADPTLVPSTPAPKRTAAQRKAVRSDSPAALYPTTAYLEIEEDQYIRRTIDAGRYGKPKVTSASAIIRFAVQHLAKTMTPEQVVAAIRDAAPETSNQGRIRL